MAANKVTLSSSAEIALSDGTSLAKGSTNIVDLQEDTGGGRFQVTTLVTAYSATVAVLIPLGSCSVAANTTYVRAWVQNLNAADTIELWDNATKSGHVKLGEILPGESYGPVLIDYNLYAAAKVTAKTPMLKAWFAQL